MKTYVITLSKNFMKGHPKAGEPTYFFEKFLKGQNKNLSDIAMEFGTDLMPKWN